MILFSIGRVKNLKLKFESKWTKNVAIIIKITNGWNQAIPALLKKNNFCIIAIAWPTLLERKKIQQSVTIKKVRSHDANE